LTTIIQAYKKGLYGPKYQWIILGGYPARWWEHPDTTHDCDASELNETLHGYIATDVLSLSSSTAVTESKLVSYYHIRIKGVKL
jgi:hypothetical protein